MRSLTFLRKEITITFVAALALALAVPQAQSSVTLFGMLDEGIEYLTNLGKTSHSVVEAASAQIYSNSIGFTGKEDLGGGLKAIFRLEGGFNP